MCLLWIGLDIDFLTDHGPLVHNPGGSKNVLTGALSIFHDSFFGESVIVVVLFFRMEEMMPCPSASMCSIIL